MLLSKKLKDFLIFFLYKTLELIEGFEYRKLILNEFDPSKKILTTTDLQGNYTQADTGKVRIANIHKTQPYCIYRVTLEDGKSFECADHHIVFRHDMREIFVDQLSSWDSIITEDGAKQVTKVEKLSHHVSMFDLTIDSPEHRYYANGVLHHNTVSAAIFILHFCTFNINKNVMIAANKRDTVNEIVSKIKEIYYLLPFFLQPAILNVNQSQITFGDTKCRIKTTAATKTAAVGFTCDLLYMDEMALIPNNISEDLYRSIFPTISAVKNSKIIITSTPNGYNLFWRLLSGAEKVPGEEGKNAYMPMRVYWWQVPGRYVSYIRLDRHLCEKAGIKPEEVYEWVQSIGFKIAVKDEKGRLIEEGLDFIYNHERGRHEIHIPNKDEKIPKALLEMKMLDEGSDNDNFLSNFFRRSSIEVLDDEGKIIRKISIRELGEVSSWKEDAVLDIGSEEAFNQEYDLQFMSGNKMLFTSQVMNKLSNALYQFRHHEIDIITQKSFVKYDGLTWLEGQPEIFDMVNCKKYYYMLGVDLAEGMGGDSSIINIFRICLKEEEEWGNIKTMYDLFKLEQVGIFKDNYTSVQEMGELLYLLCFEVLDSDRLGVILETNNWGNELQQKMMGIYQGRNSYSNHIFLRYKHRQEDAKASIGIKLRSNKNLYVKNYQTRVKCGDIIIHEETTLREMTTFIKKESSNGSTSYSADAGSHDDITMTIVEMSTAFENTIFHNLVDRLMSELPTSTQEKINKKMGESPYAAPVDYGMVSNVVKRYNSTQQANINKSNGYWSQPSAATANGNSYGLKSGTWLSSSDT